MLAAIGQPVEIQQVGVDRKLPVVFSSSAGLFFLFFFRPVVRSCFFLMIVTCFCLSLLPLCTHIFVAFGK